MYLWDLSRAACKIDLQFHAHRCDPYSTLTAFSVQVLIDGDGMVFDDELIGNGAEGGRLTAQRLNEAIKNSLRSRGLGMYCLKGDAKVAKSPQCIEIYIVSYYTN